MTDAVSVTVSSMREAWAFALAEIDSAIAFLEAEKQGADTDFRQAAERWLITLYHDQNEYHSLLRDHP